MTLTYFGKLRHLNVSSANLATDSKIHWAHVTMTFDLSPQKWGMLHTPWGIFLKV